MDFAWIYWWHCIKGNQSIEHIHNLIENTGEFPYFSNWNGPCRWIKVVFQRRLISFKKCGVVPQSYRNMAVVYPQAPKQYISNFHDICHTKTKNNYCVWEVHDLNLSTVILHFMKRFKVEIYPVFSSRMEFLLGICHIFCNFFLARSAEVRGRLSKFPRGGDALACFWRGRWTKKNFSEAEKFFFSGWFVAVAMLLSGSEGKKLFSLWTAFFRRFLRPQHLAEG